MPSGGYLTSSCHKNSSACTRWHVYRERVHAIKANNGEYRRRTPYKIPFFKSPFTPRHTRERGCFCALQTKTGWKIGVVFFFGEEQLKMTANFLADATTMPGSGKLNNSHTRALTKGCLAGKSRWDARKCVLAETTTASLTSHTANWRQQSG